MNEADFQSGLERFSETAREAADSCPIADKSVGISGDLVADAQARQEKLRQTVRTLQESLDHLRLSVKYLVFDLEATRRENDYLRKLLEATQD